MTLLLAPAAVAAKPGSLDPGFSEDGLASEGLGRGIGRWVQGVVVQPDGRAVLATSRRIARYRLNGRRDRSFSVRHVPVGDIAEAPGGDLIRLAEGEIERMLPDGKPDPSFGTAGDGRVPIPGLQLFAVAVDPLGRIVVAGRDPEAHRLAVARLLSDGSFDPGFGTLGVVRTAVSADTPANLDVGRAVAVAPDGSILVGGSAGQAEDCFVGALHCWGPYLDAVVLRYLPDGQLDERFGEGGAFLGNSLLGSAQSVAFRPGGGVLFVPGGATGAIGPGEGPGIKAVALTAGGVLDSSFADGGYSRSFGAPWPGLASSYASGLVVDGAGRALICGGVEEARHGFFLLATLRPDGQPARTFGGDGIARTRSGRKVGSRGGAEALALAPRHKLYVAGRVGRRLFVARYRL
jgi:uncharacterized delta-60 repeat protein